MESNRAREMIQQKEHYEMWNLSKKYTTHLVNNLKEHKTIDLHSLSRNIYKQLLSSFKSHNFIIKKNNKVIQCWTTMLQTIKKQLNQKLQKQSIQLLHQTSIQKSYQQ